VEDRKGTERDEDFIASHGVPLKVCVLSNGGCEGMTTILLTRLSRCYVR
jgi:hypothetical protein